MELLDFVGQHVYLPRELALKLDAAFCKEEVPKNHKLLLPDNRSQKVVFIEKGLARVYYLKDGKDITHYFFQEDSFSLPIESIFYDKPAPYGLDFLERSTIRTILYPELEKFIDQSSALEKLIRMLLIDVLKSFSSRLNELQFQSAQERYKSLIENQPEILQRAPLGHVASYLGITQQTLSVIRAQKMF